MDAGVWCKDEKRREKLALAGKQIGLAAHQQTWCWETTPGALRWSGGMAAQISVSPVGQLPCCLATSALEYRVRCQLQRTRPPSHNEIAAKSIA